MGGKKAVSAKEKSAAKEQEKTATQQKAKEDAEWEAAGEGKKSKAQAKRENKDEARSEAQQKKLEAKRLADEEAAALTASTAKAAAKKVTQYELQKQREKDQRAAAAAASNRDLQAKRDVGADEYERMVSVALDNEGEGIDARNVDAALSQLVVEEKPKMKFAQYYDRELPELRAQKPGLKAPQYKDIIWKKWQRSPDNPLNQRE